MGLHSCVCVQVGVNASAVFLQAYSPTICVFLRACWNASVGVLARSRCLGGYDCFAPLDTHFDSLVMKFCLLSEFRTWLMLQPSYLWLTLSHTLSLIHLRGLLGQTNLINIRVWNAFQYWKNLGDIWLNLPGTQRALTSQGIQGLVTSPLHFHFERVRYWFIMHYSIESCRN